MAAFYLGPMRARELLCGAVPALRLVPPIRGRVLGGVLAVTGLASIAAGLLLLSVDSRFPGVNALLPCLGAALLIHAGGSQATWGRRLLSLRAVVFVGLIAYSLHLWHWVFFAYARHLAMRMLTPGELVLLIGASVAVSVLSWRYVEQPLQRAGRATSRPASPPPVLAAAAAGSAAAGSAAAGSAAFVAVGAAFVAMNGLPERLPPLAREFAAAQSSIWPRREACDGRFCEVGDGTSGRPAVLLKGDSHAAAPALAQTAAGGRVQALLRTARRLPGPRPGVLGLRRPLRRGVRMRRARAVRHALRGEPPPFVETAAFKRRQARAHAAIESMARETRADVLHLYPSLCREGRCAIADGSRALYHDDDHLSLEGARVVRQALAPVFEATRLQ